MERSVAYVMLLGLVLFAGCAAAAATTTTLETSNRKMLQVGQIICDIFGNCDDGRGRRWYDENHDSRRHGGYDGGRRDGDHRDYGRKLQQNVVGQIICDALGNCDDGRGHRYYDPNHDNRRHGDYDGGRRDGGDHRDYGRKLQQVGQIICDALGNCDDGRGHRYYDYNHDSRHHGGYGDDGHHDDHRG